MHLQNHFRITASLSGHHRVHITMFQLKPSAVAVKKDSSSFKGFSEISLTPAESAWSTGSEEYSSEVKFLRCKPTWSLHEWSYAFTTVRSVNYFACFENRKQNQKKKTERKKLKWPLWMAPERNGRLWHCDRAAHKGDHLGLSTTIGIDHFTEMCSSQRLEQAKSYIKNK